MEQPARLTWLGHATVLVELDGGKLLTDPLLRRRVLHLRRAVPVAEDALRDVDAILVSHAHWDHLDLPSLDRLSHELPIVCPRGVGRLLRRRRFRQVVEVEPGDEVPVGAVTVSATKAEHSAGRGPFHRKAPALGFLVSGTRRIYFAGDTDLFDDMALLAPLDVALLPVAGWGRKLGPGHLDPARAARALELLQPRLAVPIHWGTYATPRHTPQREPADEFARHAARLAPEVEVRVLAPGESAEI